jgi:protein SCO1/2
LKDIIEGFVMTHKLVFSFAALLVSLTMVFVTQAHCKDNQKYQKTVEEYVIPDVTLVNQNGEKVGFRELINSKETVLLDFIFGTCTTICPILSASFTSMQDRLGADIDQVRFVSISIDPEHDTPEVMKAYLGRYGAKPGWDFFTGTKEDIDQVMRAFDAYMSDKMDHRPLTFLQAPVQNKWVRIYGLLGTSDLMKEYAVVEKMDSAQR